MAYGDPRNSEIADALAELGDLYELDGAVVHRVRAYRTAAQTVRSSTVSVAALARAGRATELPGIGETIQEKIRAFIEDGAIPAAVRLRASYPPGLIAITRLPGIGAKRARLLHDELGVDSAESLRQAATAERVRTVKGLGAKFEQRALAALAAGAAERPASRRILLPAALGLAEAIVLGLSERAPPGTRIEIAGSIRRATETVKDIDLIVITENPHQIAERLAEVPEIESVSSASRSGARAQTHAGLALDLRIGAAATYGNLLQHFTGSGAHNAALREMAVKAGLHVSEHGVREQSSGEIHACDTEQEVYERLGMAWIEPELREDRGELQAATLREQDGSTLPKLIVGEDIKGDLHCHTTASDGLASIDEMAEAAAALGYGYLAITDHSASHGFGNAVSPGQLRRQIERIRQLDRPGAPITVLAGSEVNILADGSLDYPDELLAELDWVIASVHTAFGMGQAEMTRRMIAAAEHPLVDAIGHPTGRLLLRREPYEVDVEALIEAAARAGTMLEINANPDRRDLSEIHARAAAAAGVRLLISSDAHRQQGLTNMRWGVASARRAWLRSEDVANTSSWPELRSLRKRERSRAV